MILLKKKFMIWLSKWTKLLYCASILYIFISIVSDSHAKMLHGDKYAWIWFICSMVLGTLWLERLYQNIHKQITYRINKRACEIIELISENKKNDQKGINNE